MMSSRLAVCVGDRPICIFNEFCHLKSDFGTDVMSVCLRFYLHKGIQYIYPTCIVDTQSCFMALFYMLL